MATMTFTQGDDTYLASPSPTATDPLVLDFLAGNDHLRTTSGVTEAHMGDGDDYVRIDQNSRANVFGDAGADRFDIYSAYNSLDGGSGNDVFDIAVRGSVFALETLKGGAGADRFNFMTDVPWVGGAYHASIDGGDGNDVFVGYGHDIGVVYGGAGNDFFTDMGSLKNGDFTAAYGGTGDDKFRLAPGQTSIYAAPQFIENPGEGIDTVQVAYGASYTLPDNVENLRALNFATVNEGATLTGNALANRITGGMLAETLVGLGGNDRIYGGAGDDTITGGKGNDTLSGGAGDDLFEFAAGDGHDVITDLGAGDVIRIAGYAAAQSITQLGTDVVVTLSSTDKVTFSGATVAEVGASLQFGASASGTGATITGTAGNDTLNGTSGERHDQWPRGQRHDQRRRPQ